MEGSSARIPYYIQVAETLKRRILTDEYTEESLIPPVPELEKEFNVSNITIRKALETLTQDGLIRSKRGVGTIVQKCERDLVVFELSGDFKRLVKSVDELPVELEVLELGLVPCPHHVRQMLGPDSGPQVLRMKKIRRHGGKPLSFYIHYADPSLLDRVEKAKAERMTFVDLYEEITGTKLSMLKQKLEAVVADIDLSKVLQVRFGLPLFFAENLYTTKGGKPAILTQNYYRGDKCIYTSSTNL